MLLRAREWPPRTHSPADRPMRLSRRSSVLARTSELRESAGGDRPCGRRSSKSVRGFAPSATPRRESPRPRSASTWPFFGLFGLMANVELLADPRRDAEGLNLDLCRERTRAHQIGALTMTFGAAPSDCSAPAQEGRTPRRGCCHSSSPCSSRSRSIPMRIRLRTVSTGDPTTRAISGTVMPTT